LWKLSETSFTKLFLYFENSKKSAVGLSATWALLVGVGKQVSSDLNVKTAVFDLLVPMLISH